MEPAPYKCVACNMDLLDLKSPDYLRDPPKIIDIIVCGGCSLPNKVTLTGTEVLSVAEFESLDEDTKKQLDFAYRAVKRHARSNGST